MMSEKKSIRAGLLIAAALVLLFVAFKSPGEAQKMEEADDIIVSQEDSFCAGDLVLELSDAGGYPIYYTLDGSIPGFESGFYEDPIAFTATDEVQSCVLRARSYDESTGEWGDLFTRTYFYADSMETLKERFSTYIVCLTSDPYNLYDYEYGIMVEGKIRDEYVNSPEYISGKLTQPANFTQQGRDWERDAFVEILSPDGERLIAQDAGMRIFGHASRQYYYKSFKLYARKAYGNDTFAYPFFADNTHGADQKVQDAYQRLVVRAHGFDKSVTLFREELFQTLCSQIEGIDSKSVAPASVWLNGGYYNFEWLQEVYDDTYMEENYGLMQEGDYYQKLALRANKLTLSIAKGKTDSGDEDEEEAVGTEEAEPVVETTDRTPEEEQASKDYHKMAEYAEKDLTDDETFAELEQLVDIDNMIQYFAIETYIANWDWPLNNIKLYRYYSQNNVYGTGRQDGRWRYLYYDMEAGFNIYNEEPEDWLDIETVMEQNPLFGAVMKRPDMQEKFAKYIELCIKEYFTEDRVRAAVEKLCGERDSELAESFAYKHSIDESYTMNMDDVERNKEVIYDFVEKRPEMMRQQIQELFGIEL
ncbi:CotH kinase family protein [Clostridiaceae bacterium Marseille-Q4145]|nr:CotH kinase family protein [Clostridiaceae bacterium Marseille-Q4145]